MILANAAHIRNVPGRKSDVNDATWIADLLAHGLIRASFVPPQPIQELRDLTRTRTRVDARSRASHPADSGDAGGGQHQAGIGDQRHPGRFSGGASSRPSWRAKPTPERWPSSAVCASSVARRTGRGADRLHPRPPSFPDRPAFADDRADRGRHCGFRRPDRGGAGPVSRRRQALDRYSRRPAQRRRRS